MQSTPDTNASEDRFFPETLLTAEPEDGEPVAQDELRIQALLAPTSTSWLMTDFESFGPKHFSDLDSATFIIKADRLPQAMRCSCLAESRKCERAVGDQHYVVEWKVGSKYHLEPNENGEMVVGKGLPIKYKGYRKGGDGAIMTLCDKLVCIEGWRGDAPKPARNT